VIEEDEENQPDSFESEYKPKKRGKAKKGRRRR